MQNTLMKFNKDPAEMPQAAMEVKASSFYLYFVFPARVSSKKGLLKVCKWTPITNWSDVWVWNSEADRCDAVQSLLYIYRHMWRCEDDGCLWLAFQGRYEPSSWQSFNEAHQTHLA